MNAGLKSPEVGSLTAESAALAKGVDFLNRPGIEFKGDRISGYEYKKWTPLVIPFIQASSDIWNPVTTTPDTSSDWQNGAEHLPFNVFIPAGQHFDFQLLTPKDHPFLLVDVKVAANIRRQTEGEPSPIVESRFRGPFDPFVGPNGALFRKYAFPNNENIDVTIIAVSPGGKPLLGGDQNVVGMDNSVRTVGPVPHTERVCLTNMQNHRSGRGSLQHHLLFPTDGIIRVTVENRNLNQTVDVNNPDGAFVNGAVFGYVIME